MTRINNHKHSIAIVISAALILFIAAFNNGLIAFAFFGTLDNIPTHTTPTLSSTQGFNSTDENLTCYNQSTQDLDGDEVKNIFNWYKDGTSITVLNMPFEGGSNLTYTKDYSGNNNHGTVINATWESSGGHDGRGAYSFDGAGSGIQLTSTGCLVSNSWTLEFWLYPSDPANYSRLFIQGDDECAGRQIMAYWHEDHVEVLTLTGEIAGNPDTQTETISNNQWTHFVWTYDGSTHKLYLNGQTSSGTATGGNAAVLGENYIGRRHVGNSWKGKLDEIRLYNLALSQEQIQTLYNDQTNTITSQETSVGDVWQTTVTPNDGAQDGTTLPSNELEIRTMPTPSSINNLNNISAGTTWIYWNWTNPTTVGYDENIVYINGLNAANTTNNYYNSTGLNANTTYTITLHTKNINEDVNTTDVNNTAITNEPACSENWIANYTACNISDNRIKFYNDNNSCGTNNSLPGDNGTTDSCNYCSYSLTNTTWTSWTNQTECLVNNTYVQNRSRIEHDENYNSCYDITGLVSDLWNNGTNETHWDSQTLSCTYASNNGGSGGGGGGGGSITPTTNISDNNESDENVQNTVQNTDNEQKECLENWKCESWSNCEDGIKTRTCVDKNKCDKEQQKEKIECSELTKQNNELEEKNTNYDENNLLTGRSISVVDSGLSFLMIITAITAIFSFVFAKKNYDQKTNNQLHKKLNEYVTNSMNNGLSLDTIKYSLKSVGWPKEFVENYIKEFMKRKKNEPTPNPDF